MSNTAKNTRYIGSRTSASHHKVLEPHFFSAVCLTHLVPFGIGKLLDSDLSKVWRIRYRSLVRYHSFDIDQSAVVKSAVSNLLKKPLSILSQKKEYAGQAPRKRLCNSWNKANGRKFPFSDHCFDWSELVVRRQQIEQAKLGKRLALPNTHRAIGNDPQKGEANDLWVRFARRENKMFDLLEDTPRKDARQKTLLTSVGRRSAIKLVRSFRSEMGGLAWMFNCESENRKKDYKRDDSTAGCDVLWFQRSTSV